MRSSCRAASSRKAVTGAVDRDSRKRTRGSLSSISVYTANEICPFRDAESLGRRIKDVSHSLPAMPQTSLISWLKQPKAPTALGCSPAELNACSTDPVTPNEGHTEKVQAEIARLDIDSLHRGFHRVGASLPNAVIEICTQDLVPSLKRLNTTLFPIPYQEKFYKEITDDPVTASITRVALWRPVNNPHTSPPDPSKSSPHPAQLVGAVRCRLLAEPPYSSSDKTPTLYIATIGVLAPFRRNGLASVLLADVIKSSAARYEVGAVVAHVWEKHEESLQWYKRRGFTVVGKDEGYYRRLAPHTSAWIVRRDIKVSDLSEG